MHPIVMQDHVAAVQGFRPLETARQSDFNVCHGNRCKKAVPKIAAGIDQGNNFLFSFLLSTSSTDG